jgi:hypothetical protein
LHTKAPLPAVANALHSPRYGGAFRLDPWRFDAPFGARAKKAEMIQPAVDRFVSLRKPHETYR